MQLDPAIPLALEVTTAVRAGDLAALAALLDAHPGLAAARLVDGERSCTWLHVANDWPGRWPEAPAVMRLLVDAGADVGARYAGPHEETPLHFAASNDDVVAVDTLLDLGADIDAPGGVIAGLTPLADARAFGTWRAAARLVERGAATTLVDEATLGLQDRVAARFAGGPVPPDEVTRAFWGACHGARTGTARFLLDRGADLDWLPPWEPLTPLDAAERRHREEGRGEDLLGWLRERGARGAAELR